MIPDRLFLWIIFNIFVLGMLTLDLGVFHRKAHAVTTREATTWCLVWVTLAIVFNAVMYVFGAFLVFTGIKMLVKEETTVHPEDNAVIKLLRRLMPISPDYEGQSFFVRNRRWAATPLFVVLLVVESTDLIFAVDSVPAIFAVSRDPFIVYTSNVFAILGLRSLYFLLAGIIDLFIYLRYGLGVVLGFVGIKMLLVDIYKIPIGISLAVVAGILTLSIVASLFLQPGSR